MRISCKKCKRNLTGEAIKHLEGKIDKIVCLCEDEELRDKIAIEFDLFGTRQKYLNEFDNFLDKLVKENGTTGY